MNEGYQLACMLWMSMRSRIWFAAAWHVSETATSCWGLTVLIRANRSIGSKHAFTSKTNPTAQHDRKTGWADRKWTHTSNIGQDTCKTHTFRSQAPVTALVGELWRARGSPAHFEHRFQTWSTRQTCTQFTIPLYTAVACIWCVQRTCSWFHITSCHFGPDPGNARLQHLYQRPSPMNASSDNVTNKCCQYFCCKK